MRKGAIMAKRGLYANIHAKKKRIAAGSGEKMRKVGTKGAPTAANFKRAAKTAKKPRKKKIMASAAWTRKAGKSPSGGLNAKGRASYKKGTLKAPTKSKTSSRRKSFCARMGGMKKKLTSAKTARDPNSRINKSLRKWDC